MATIVDVARLAGVGTTTVTKVLSGRRQVSSATRERVREAITALDYHPSSAGRTLRTGITRVMGVITAPPSSHPFAYPFFPAVLEGIGDCAAAHGYDVLWITADGSRSARRPYDALFKSKRVDGLIDAWVWAGDSRHGAEHADGHPVVLIGHPDDTSIPHVDAANRDGGAQVGRAFVVRGYSRVGYLGILEAPASHDRLLGLSQVLDATGAGMQPYHVLWLARERAGGGQVQFGYTSMRGWIRQGDVPRAVLAHTDEIAYGVLRACRELGWRVPEDVAVVGFDDGPSSEHIHPPLASVRQPIRELGFEAASLLLELLSGRLPDPAVRILPTRLIERDSLGAAPPTSDALHGSTERRIRND